MDAILHSLLIGTTIPSGLRFNDFGVAMNGLRHEFRVLKLKVEFDVCSLNGLWGGELDITTNLWGCASPIMQESFIYPTFEECADNLWKDAYEKIARNKANISSEFLHFKVAVKEWFTRSPEEKFNSFKEVEFYA